MDHESRTRIIINKVLPLDVRFGRSAAAGAVGAGKPGRWISDDARWMALVVPDHTREAPINGEGPGEGAWSLFQLFSYDQLRVTAVFRGEDVMVRLYTPGPWERVFFPIDLPADAPTIPGGYAGALSMARGADVDARTAM